MYTQTPQECVNILIAGTWKGYGKGGDIGACGCLFYASPASQAC